VDGGVRAVVGGIVLHGRSLDDLRFVGELFFENAYNFGIDRQTAVFDVGMNVGLAALHFARKAEVAEVHAFEPFPETFERAVANIALNPALSAKITPHRFGLSDRDFDGPILINDKGDSGAMTTVGAESGVAVQLSLRDAGPLLAPLIEDAVGRGLEVILKVDCEGSEFAVFESLQRNGLLGKIRAFLVEWHSMFDGKSQETLLAPLRQAGFLVFDRSPPVGNGFFYAVRITG
jgi:FkbM family methyltransferase